MRLSTTLRFETARSLDFESSPQPRSATPASRRFAAFSFVTRSLRGGRPGSPATSGGPSLLCSRGRPALDFVPGPRSAGFGTIRQCLAQAGTVFYVCSVDRNRDTRTCQTRSNPPARKWAVTARRPREARRGGRRPSGSGESSIFQTGACRSPRLRSRERGLRHGFAPADAPTREKRSRRAPEPKVPVGL